MRRKNRAIGGVSALATIAAVACGGDSTAPEEAVLDQVAGIQIASTLVSEIITIGFSALSGSPEYGADGGPLDAASGYMETISEIVPCHGGGSTTISGSYTNTLGSTGTGTVAYDLRQKPVNCVISTSQGAYTVNGNPEFGVAGSLTVSSWTLGVFQFTYGGGFRWSGAGGSGSCDIDLTYNFNYASQTYTGSGHMCGYRIDWNQGSNRNGR